MKEDVQNVTKNCNRITSPVGVEDINWVKLRDQEGLPPSSMKIFFLVTIIRAKILDTKKFIVNPMQEITIWRNINDYGYPKDNHANDRYAQRIFCRNYNPFSPMMDQNNVCYKWNTIGHKVGNWRNMEENDFIIKEEDPNTTWEKKQKQWRL